MANDNKGTKFEAIIFRACGRDVGNKIVDNPDNVFKAVAMALFSVFLFNRNRYNGFAVELAEAFYAEIPATLANLEKQQQALTTLKRFPLKRKRRFDAIRAALLNWQKVLPALVGLAKAYAYIGRPWQFVTRDSAQFLHLETPEGAAWRMLREYAEAFRRGNIDGKTAQAHGPLIKRVLVDETGLVQAADFKEVLKWAMKKSKTYPEPTADQVMEDDAEEATTNLGDKLKEAKVAS